MLPHDGAKFPPPPGITHEDVRGGAHRAQRPAARTTTSSATSARCSGSSWRPSASCCSSPARTSPTSCWCAPKGASRNSPSAPRSAPAGRRSRVNCCSRASPSAVLGGVLGLGLACGRLRLLVAIGPDEPAAPGRDRDRLRRAGLHARRSRCSRASSSASSPCFNFARPQLGAALREGGRTSSDGRERHRARNALVVVAGRPRAGPADRLRTDDPHVPGDAAACSPGFTGPEQILTLRVPFPRRR